jgi:hypothetical protein
MRLWAPLFFLRVRFGQITSSARYQISMLTTPSARAHVYVPPSQDWGRSPLIRIARKWMRLGEGATADVRLVQSFRTLLHFAGSVAFLSLSLLLIAYNSLRVVKNRHADAVDLVNRRSGYGHRPILLFAHSVLLVPELARFAAQLGQQSRHVEKVAVIVPNRAVEAALKPLTGSAAIINMQQFWLDQSIDIVNHDLIKQVLDLCRAERSSTRPDRAPTKSQFDLFEEMYVDLHVELLQMLRLGCAMQAALHAGRSTIAVCFSVPREQHEFFRDFLQTPSHSAIAALVTRNVYHHELLVTVDPRPCLSEMIRRTRARLAIDLTKTDGDSDRLIVASTAKRVDRDPRSVALISDGAPGSSYWPTVLNLAVAAKQSGRSLRILVESPSAAQVLRQEGFVVDEFSLAGVYKPDLNFRNAYASLLDELEVVTSRLDAASDPRLVALRNHLVARFARSEADDRAPILSFRLHEQIERWMLAHRFGSIVVLPHWGRLAWAAVGVANTLNIPSASTPAVSVAGNSASIVGWNRLDLVGCYGLQCRDAFVSQGYPPDRLQLTGSLALDRAMQVSRENAHERLKTFGALARGERRILLYATSGSNKNEREILANIVELCRDPVSKVVLVVRPHPSIGRAYYEEAVSTALGSGQRGVAAVISEGTAHDNIAAADVVITDFSTVGAEAVLIGRPLLVVNTTGKPFPANNYADLGVAAQANSIDEIRPTLQRLLKEGAFWADARASLEAFTKAYNWGGDGQAGARLLAGLEELACCAQAQDSELSLRTCLRHEKAVEGWRIHPPTPR